MRKYKKRSIIILVSVICLLALIIVFMLSLLNSITTKMNQGSSQSLMNSTRMIQSSISSELENDMEQIESSASLFVMSGGEKDAAKTLANYAAATEFFRFYYIDLNGTGINSDGERVDAAALPFEETALSKGKRSYSDAYVGDSGRLQVTFQAPVLSDGRQVGALYADKTLSRYNDPALFTFSGGSGNAYVVDGCMGSWIEHGRYL